MTTDSHRPASGHNLILFFDGCLLLNGESPMWPSAALDGWDACTRSRVHVAPLQAEHPPCDAVQLASVPPPLTHVEAMPVRQFLLHQGFDAFVLAGRASQLLNWQRTHRFCGSCGAANAFRSPGQILYCPHCEVDYYPRINPCIIVLVTRGDRILLARSVRRGATFFSCLAGFIEPGESAEEAVAREVYEEVGIKITNIRYVKSQPWPFPSQLMLGFYADYVSGDIVPEAAEIAEAHWYPVDSLPETPAPAISVAGQLIQEYCDAARASADL
ncbi:MAG: NAD(+) diphosphatase [Pseudohongiella sp.]|uniref:NAD(+) diphosphatase n=1 Tax=Pseudohongiella sp. TaxID=1979412 RepID=UPI0034A09D31